MQSNEQNRDEIWHKIMPLVYDQLHKLARQQFQSERANHTLQPTALIHEVFERIVDANISIENQKHFFNLCCQIMRRVLVDHARKNNSQKKGGEVQHLCILEQGENIRSNEINLVELDRLLNELHSLQQRQAQIAELYYFGGLAQDKIAQQLDVSPRTVFRELRFIRAWLNMQLEGAA